MLVTLTHPVANFTGTVTVRETIVLPFTNGTSNIDVDPTAFGEIQSAGITISIGAQAPAPPYDANLDTVVAPLVTNSGSTTATALRAAFGAQLSVRPLPAVALGHSNVVRDATAGPQRTPGSWFAQVCALSGQGIRFLRNLGVAGQTSAQILARVPDVIALKPAVCFIQCMANDVRGSIPAATTKANVTAMWSQLIAAGITPIHVTDFPQASTNGAAISALNAWVTGYGQRHGIVVLDGHSPAVDPATNDIAAAYASTDGLGLHLNAAGDFAVAQSLWQQLTGVLAGPPPYMASALGDPSDLLGGYGTFAVDSNADGLSDGWNAIGGPSAITYTRPAGGWQKVTRPAGSTGTGYLTRSITTGWSHGDVLAVSGQFQIAGAGATFTVGVECNSGDATQDVMPLNSWSSGSGAFYMEGTIPAGAASLDALIACFAPTAGVDTSIQLRRLTVVNLTTGSVLA
jgi:lysophospholipase L1-like esterase